MFKIILFYVKILLLESLYIAILFIAIKQNQAHSSVNEDITINGSINLQKINTVNSVHWKKINYGESGTANINLIMECDSCKIYNVLTECTCTNYTIKEKGVSKGDTILLSISMKGVERGLQIRRIHLFCAKDNSIEAHSITLTANVK
jgi:hypothetical protein